MATAPRRVVNIDCYYEYEEERKRTEALGAELILQKSRGESELVGACADADVVLVEEVPLTAPILARMARCRTIIQYGVGVDNIDVVAATGCGIPVCNMAEFCTEEVSDHAVALLLACARQVVAMDRNIRAGGWFDFPQPTPLRRVGSLTLGMIGLGRIGLATARKMAGFRMRILAFDPKLSQSPAPEIELVPLERVLRESDLVSVHTPLTKETRRFIGESVLRAMKPSAFIVNTSRGAVIDETALVRALGEKWIAGAGLDVVAEEPLPASSRLREFSNVVLTPHFAGVSVEAKKALHTTVADAIEAVLSGFWPPFPVNPQVKPRFPLRPWSEFRPASLRDRPKSGGPPPSPGR